MQAQEERQAPGCHAEHVARAAHSAPRLRRRCACSRSAYSLWFAPEEYARRTLAQRRRHLARVLEGLPAQLQQQPLLRVEAHGLAGRNAEEARVERLDIVQEAALGHVGPVLGLGVGVVPVGGVPPACRYFGGRDHAVRQQSPVGVQIVRPPGEAAGGSHDCDGLVHRYRPGAGHPIRSSRFSTSVSTMRPPAPPSGGRMPSSTTATHRARSAGGCGSARPSANRAPAR